MSEDLMFDEYGFGYNENDQSFERWGNIVRTDHDYDGDFLIRIVTHKLGLMRDYFIRISEKYPEEKKIGNDKDIFKVISAIDNAYQLGKKILTFNYGEEADKIFEEKGEPRWLIESSEEEDYKEWSRLSEEATENRRKDIEKFFRNIGKHIDDWWR